MIYIYAEYTSNNKQEYFYYQSIDLFFEIFKNMGIIICLDRKNEFYKIIGQDFNKK